jgi:hypothetical protein
MALAAIATWVIAIPQQGALDITGPRTDGQRVVAAAGTLALLRGVSALTPFARGDGGYQSTAGEPYIALSNRKRVRAARCSFAPNDVFALEPSDQNPTVRRIGADGVVQDAWATIPPGGFLSGIGFDTVGDFGYRLLVTVVRGDAVDLVAIDCRGRPEVLGTTQPLYAEGGIAVAPRSFGRYGGQLIAVDEQHGGIIAFDRRGHGRVIAQSGLPAGGDIGVEAVGFIPDHALGSTTALLADRGGQAQPHPGSDAFLGVKVSSLLRAGARRGDLVAASEGGAATVAVRCPRTCHVRHVADGPAVAHTEGHIVFAR